MPKDNHPLLIYVAENNHGDMSYASLTKQLIEQCDNEALRVKVFSEFESQTLKTTMRLSNVPSDEIHQATTKFLDSRFIPMSSLQERWGEIVPKAKEELLREIKTPTPEDVLNYFRERGGIDNPAILKVMEGDLAKGEIPKMDNHNNAARDAEEYYKFWGGCLNYKTVHEAMARDVRKNLEGQDVPDVIIVVAGNAHIPSLEPV